MNKKTFKPCFYTKNVEQILKEDNLPIIFFDTETTGINKKKDFLVQISAYKFVKTQEGYAYNKQKLNKYVRPPIPMPAEASAINHITDEMLKDKPTEEEAFKEIYDFFGSGENVIVSGYNVGFDIAFLSNLYLRCCGKPFEPAKIIDVMSIAKELLDREELLDNSYNLSSASKVFGIEESNMHSSETDTFVTVKLLKSLLDDFNSKDKVDYESRPKLEITNISNFKKSKTTNYIMVYVKGFANGQFITGHLHYDKYNYRYVEDAGNLFDLFDMVSLAKEVERRAS